MTVTPSELDTLQHLRALVETPFRQVEDVVQPMADYLAHVVGPACRLVRMERPCLLGADSEDPKGTVQVFGGEGGETRVVLGVQGRVMLEYGCPHEIDDGAVLALELATGILAHRCVERRATRAERFALAALEELKALEPDLRQLDVLAALACEVVGVRAAALVALDTEGRGIAGGIAGGPEMTEARQRQELWSMLAECEGSGTDIAAFYLNVGGAVRSVYLGGDDSPVGLLLTVHDDETTADRNAHMLELYASLCALQLRNATSRQLGHYGGHLHEVSRALSGERVDMAALVTRLKQAFRADTASAWFQDGEQLFLSASTDSRLSAKDEPYYHLGQGLTGTVWQRGTPIAIPNTRDLQHVASVIGKPYAGATHPEFGEDEQEHIQFLGVPMMVGDSCVGVIRLSRTARAVHFASEERDALALIGAIVGLRHRDRVQQFVNEQIWGSEVAAVFLSRRNRLAAVSEGAAAMLGTTRDALIASGKADALYSLEDRDRVRAAIKRLRNQPGRSEQLKVTLSRGGAQVHVDLRLRLVFDDMFDRPHGFLLGIANELTEREEAALRGRRIVELLDRLGIVYFRSLSDGRLLYSTDSESSLLGYTREQLETMERSELFMNRTSRDELLRKLREADGLLQEQTVLLRRADGSRIVGETNLLLYEVDGQTVVEGIWRDAQARIELQELLDLPTEQVLQDIHLVHTLKAEAEARVDFLTILAHQLKSPLNALLGHLGSVNDGFLTGQRLRERLPYLMGQLRVLFALVDNLFFVEHVLGVGRIDAESRTQVRVYQLATQVLGDFNRVAARKSVKLQVQQELHQLDGLVAHEALLRQVLINLIDNAVKYSFRKHPVVVARCANGFQVESCGMPVGDDERSKLFDRRFRGRAAHRDKPGNGLGLWLVRKICEAHGWTASYHQKERQDLKWNVFRVEIPEEH